MLNPLLKTWRVNICIKGIFRNSWWNMMEHFLVVLGASSFLAIYRDNLELKGYSGYFGGDGDTVTLKSAKWAKNVCAKKIRRSAKQQCVPSSASWIFAGSQFFQVCFFCKKRRRPFRPKNNTHKFTHQQKINKNLPIHFQKPCLYPLRRKKRSPLGGALRRLDPSSVGSVSWFQTFQTIQRSSNSP